MRLLALFFLALCLASAIEPKAEPSSLLTTKRVFVDKFGAARQPHEFATWSSPSLPSSGLFVLGENQERADVTF